MTELHIKYAPILRFNKDEKFFPMRVDDMLGYSGLYVKGRREPVLPCGQVTPEKLQKYRDAAPVFLRSVEAGPLSGREVITEWGTGALEMVYRWAATRPSGLTESLARKAYDWFSPKTQEATQLFWWNDLVSHVLGEGLYSLTGDALPRLVLPRTTQDNAVARYQASFQGSPAYTYYYRYVRDKGYVCLQYWFFYSYNNWGQGFGGMNDHEGDWEGMMLFFRQDALGRPQEPPAYVTFADHESRQTKPWEHHDVTRLGAHVVGYVAAGSHATYPEARKHALMKLYDLFDYATGDGVTIDHDDWIHCLNLDQVDWLGAYQGTWGTRYWLSVERAKTVLRGILSATPLGGLTHLLGASEIPLPGVSAPRGPIDPRRPQYADPVTWAGIPGIN